MRHVRDAHGLSVQDYRTEVFSRELAYGPSPVTAQTLRSRVYAYKAAFCDATFREGVCASCAQFKRMDELQAVHFPTPGDERAPTWLGWSAEEWQLHKMAWREQVDAVLNIDVYLKTYLRAPERIRAADSKVFAARLEHETAPGALKAAERWLVRVLRWRDNM